MTHSGEGEAIAAHLANEVPEEKLEGSIYGNYKRGIEEGIKELERYKS